MPYNSKRRYTNRMTSDYITITTWNTKLQKVEYHYVPKSIKNPKQYVKSLHPEQVILVNE